jgi:hypothetical protein
VSDVEQRIDDLSDVERGMLIRELAEAHPRITKQLLDWIDLHRKREAVRQSMPQHPLTPHEGIPGLRLCYFRRGDAMCLRGADDPLHAVAAATGGAR